MSIALDSPSRLNTRQVPGWMLALAIVIATVSLSPWAGELSRPLFVIGCAVTGWYAWRQGPGYHLQAALVLFALAPFVRRIVDLSAGYDPFGLMLTGPFACDPCAGEAPAANQRVACAARLSGLSTHNSGWVRGLCCGSVRASGRLHQCRLRRSEVVGAAALCGRADRKFGAGPDDRGRYFGVPDNSAGDRALRHLSIHRSARLGSVLDAIRADPVGWPAYPVWCANLQHHERSRELRDLHSDWTDAGLLFSGAVALLAACSSCGHRTLAVSLSYCVDLASCGRSVLPPVSCDAQARDWDCARRLHRPAAGGYSDAVRRSNRRSSRHIE